MKIDGKLLAESILLKLAADVAHLASRGVIPTLAVILVGDNPASLAYIKQKQKAADRIGAHIVFDHQPATMTPDDLRTRIKTYNSDPSVHSLITQRPVPEEMENVSDILNTISHEKDVDGFLPDSPFDVPVALAVGEILKFVHSKSTTEQKDYITWVKEKHIVVIGKGETAGAPILRYLEKQHCTTSLIHSQTPNPTDIMKQADIIISCVGKERVVPAGAVKSGAILISVGLWRNQIGKLRGDYEEDEIADSAAWYTPTPGGVGPVNVACLMQNLIKACKMNTAHLR